MISLFSEAYLRLRLRVVIPSVGPCRWSLQRESWSAESGRGEPEPKRNTWNLLCCRPWSYFLQAF